MNNEIKAAKVREPLFHIIKKDAIVWWKAWLIRVAAVIVALMVVALVTLVMTGQNPLEMYKAMVDGAVGNSLRTWNLLQDTAILLIVALAVTPAFKMRFWNIGAQGQILAGVLATTACLRVFSDVLPTPLLFVTMIICAMAAGAVWALIPGIFKAYLNTNETLFTLMMNYIAINLVAFFCFRWSKNSGNDVIGLINRKSKIGWLPEIGGNKFLLIIIIVAVLTVLSFIYLKYSKHGYEISVVGESENTARYIGINVKKVIIRTVILSGAICGFAGFLMVSGIHHTMTTEVEGGRGFTAIIVSWMAHFNPLYMVLTSFLIVFLEKGAIQVASSKNLQLDDNFSSIVIGIIILFIIGCEFFINYEIKFKSRSKPANTVEEAKK
ncbi:MAG: ABC transporter permease [Clostridia bacterium]|nr:ABC transporter permease [Clostridia bacterium]